MCVIFCSELGRTPGGDIGRAVYERGIPAVTPAAETEIVATPREATKETIEY